MKAKTGKSKFKGKDKSDQKELEQIYIEMNE